jgi:hypothetical protein
MPQTKKDFLDYLNADTKESYDEWLRRVAPEQAEAERQARREARESDLLHSLQYNQALLDDPNEPGYVKTAAKSALAAVEANLDDIDAGGDGCVA